MSATKLNPFRMLDREARTASVQNHASARPNSQVSATSEFSAPRKLTEMLIQTARDLQILPDIAMQAIVIADDPDARVTRLVNIVAQDIKLTTDIISLSNSSIFGASKSVAGLQQAITRVGFRQTKNMILASCIASLMQKMDWHEIRVRNMLCQHSFLTAVLNSRLNSLFQLGLQGEEFTAGLTHDIGRTLLAVSLPEEFNSFDPLDFDESDNVTERESELIGTSHAEIGAWFLQRNHLPEELITVARFHHSPRDATRFKRLVAVTAIADDMANYSQREPTGSKFDCKANDHLEILESLGVDSPTERLEGSAAELLDSARAEVKRLIVV